MPETRLESLRSPWLWWSVLLVSVTVLASLLVGFVWLPAMQGDFSAQGVWASICRAAGVPGQWGDAVPQPGARLRTTEVVLNQAMARPGSAQAVGRGATLALQCTICHGAQGLSGTDAPNLAGQYSEVIAKQLADYKRGDRNSSIMQALAQGLSDRDVQDLAAYYAELLRSKSTANAPALIRVGDPMRNIAPCASCHGSIDHKLGAPWLDGMPKAYIAAQLTAFETGQRKNDSHAQMRNMARRLSASEVEEIASFYARP